MQKTSKYLVYSLLCIFVIQFGLTRPVAAAGTTTVRGVIANNADLALFHRVVGATVDVSCTHHGVAHPLSTTSIADGNYHVEYDDSLCSLDDLVVVTAHTPSLAGSNSGFVFLLFGDNTAVINVVTSPTPISPEFSQVTGMLTLVFSAAIYWIFKNRYA